MHNARRLAVVLCVAVLLIAVLVPAASGLPFGILVPLWLFFAAIVALSIRPPVEDCHAERIAYYSILPSRAPPIPSSF